MLKSNDWIASLAQAAKRRRGGWMPCPFANAHAPLCTQEAAASKGGQKTLRQKYHRDDAA
jgi:hypothetical protein